MTKPNFYSPQQVPKGKYDGQGIKCFLGGAQSDFCMLGTGSYLVMGGKSLNCWNFWPLEG